MLNDVTFVEAARGFAERMMSEPRAFARRAAGRGVLPGDGAAAAARGAGDPGRRLSRPARAFRPRSQGRAGADQPGRVAARRAARPGRAGGVHGHDATDPESRRDAHEGVIHRGPAPRAPDSCSLAGTSRAAPARGWGRLRWLHSCDRELERRRAASRPRRGPGPEPRAFRISRRAPGG